VFFATKTQERAEDKDPELFLYPRLPSWMNTAGNQKVADPKPRKNKGKEQAKEKEKEKHWSEPTPNKEFFSLRKMDRLAGCKDLCRRNETCGELMKKLLLCADTDDDELPSDCENDEDVPDIAVEVFEDPERNCLSAEDDDDETSNDDMEC
jgi:hypothetical protein